MYCTAPTAGWKLTNHHKTYLSVQCDILCNCCSSFVSPTFHFLLLHFKQNNWFKFLRKLSHDLPIGAHDGHMFVAPTNDHFPPATPASVPETIHCPATIILHPSSFGEVSPHLPLSCPPRFVDRSVSLGRPAAMLRTKSAEFHQHCQASPEASYLRRLDQTSADMMRLNHSHHTGCWSLLPACTE